jgi:endoglucanase
MRRNALLSRRSLIALGAFGIVSKGVRGPATAATAPISKAAPVAGINLAGADFGKIPGLHGREYLYPTRQNVDYYRALGFSLVRLPFKWERLQPRLMQPFAPQDQAPLFKIVQHATALGMQVILDPHNYAKRRIVDDGWSAEHMIGSEQVPVAAFYDFWARLAKLFADNNRVVFGLMNEPTGIGAVEWLTVVNGAIAAIRVTGAQQLILIPGVAYSGAHSWFSAQNTIMESVVDPADRFAFDVHQYFDTDSSGTHPEVVSGMIGSERIEAFQTWARQRGFRAVLGEFNGARNQTAYNALHDICQEMDANRDVWLGWAAWAGGPRWPENEMFNLEPWRDGRMREQTEILARYARAKDDAWVTDGAAFDADFARRRIFGSHSFDDLVHSGSGQSGTVAEKGLFVDPRMAESTVRATGISITGRLRDLLRKPEMTLVIEVREIPPSPGNCNFMTADSHVLMQRTGAGAVTIPDVAGLETTSQAIGNWRRKRRIAVTFGPDNVLALAATGAGAAQALLPSALTLFRAQRIAILPCGGYLRRIIGFSRRTPADELNAMVS